MQLLDGSSSLAFASKFFTVSQYCGLYSGRLEPTLRSNVAARSPCALFNGRVLFRGKVAICAPLKMSRAPSLPTSMPTLAI